MKKGPIFLILSGIIFFLMYNCNVSCTNAGATKKLDIVNGTAPMDIHDIEWRKAFIAELKELSPEQRIAQINRVLPRLNAQLVASLHKRGLACEIVSISYGFGTGDAEAVGSGDGHKYDGVFEDQLFAIVKGKPGNHCFKDSLGFRDSLVVFVQCFNGTFVINGEATYGDILIPSTSSPRFTIEKGMGINHYVDYRTSIWLAKKMGLKIFKGKGRGRKEITPESAYEFEPYLGRIFVNVPVNEGDQFDLGRMTYTPANKK